MAFLPVFDHARHKGHDAVDYATEIDAQAKIPVVVSPVLHGTVDGNAGVIT